MRKIDRSRPAGRLSYLLAIILLFTAGLRAQTPTTTLIQDVVYRANGTPAGGSLVISWPAFETLDHKTVAAGVISVKLGDGGSLAVPLVPNQGATPEGTYYTVVVKLDDGTTKTEFWNVPNVSPATVADVRTTILPGPVEHPAENYVRDAEVASSPQPNKIPRADANGKIPEAWISNTVFGPLQHDSVTDVLSCPTCVTRDVIETITGAKTFAAGSGASITASGGSGASDYAIRVTSGNTWIGPDRSQLSGMGQYVTNAPGTVRHSIVSQMPPAAGTVVNQRVADFGDGGGWGDETIFGNYDVAGLKLTADPPNGQLMANAHQVFVDLNGHSLGILNANDAWFGVEGGSGSIVNGAVDFHASGGSIAPGVTVPFASGFYAEPLSGAAKNVGYYTDGGFSTTEKSLFASQLFGRNWLGVNPVFFSPLASRVLYHDDQVNQSITSTADASSSESAIQLGADFGTSTVGPGTTGVYIPLAGTLSADSPTGSFVVASPQAYVNTNGHHLGSLSAVQPYLEFSDAANQDTTGTVDWVITYDTAGLYIGNVSVSKYAAFRAGKSGSAATNYGFYADPTLTAGDWAFYSEAGKSYFGGNVGIGSTNPLGYAKTLISGTGAGTQWLLALENLQSAAADAGSGLLFAGQGSYGMGFVKTGWEGASQADAYLSFGTRGSQSVLERMRITAAGDIVFNHLHADSGTRFLCIDTAGKLVSSTSACSGT